MSQPYMIFWDCFYEKQIVAMNAIFAFMRCGWSAIYVSPVKFIHEGHNRGTKGINTTVRNTYLAGIRNYTIS